MQKVDELCYKEIAKLKKDTNLKFKSYRDVAIKSYDELNRAIKNIQLILKRSANKTFMLENINELDADMTTRYKDYSSKLKEFYSVVNNVLLTYKTIIRDYEEDDKK